MNRLLYRVVFNKARGMLMVVADIARACSGGSASSGIGHNHRRLICRLSTISLSLWLASGAVQTAQATIVADKSAPGKQQPTVIASANGTPQVNIQTPSAGGVSRNTYSRFDVDKKGVILNNSRKNTATQLGGMVSANPWLAKGEAKIILNEVNARDPSRLNGYIEVAGQKAQVVIASPSGITCNGCGFINAGRATLTTGTAQMQNSNLTGYQVNRGEVVIEGKGLDTSRQDYTDIIARTVKVNAAIYAGDLKVTTGRNRVDAAHETTTAQADDGSLKPQLALDVSQVGGMYAGKIRLRATEQGVGVRNAGTIGSEAGLVTITADGRIENSGELSSQQSLQVSSVSGVANSGKMLSQQGLSVNTTGGISNSGSVWSSADATLVASGAVQNSGSVAARNNVALAGSSLTSSSKSTLAAGVQSDGHTGSSGDLTLSAAGKLEMNGLNLAGGSIHAAGQGLNASGSQTQAKNITLNAKQGDLSTASAQVIASGTLTAMTAGTLNNAAGQVAADKLSLTARRLENQQGQLIQSGTQSLTLSHQDGINNHGGLIQSGGDMRLDAQQNALINRDTQDSGGIISFGRLNVTAGKISNQNGMLAGAGETAVQATEVDNSEGTLASESGLQLNAQDVNNRNGALSAGMEMALKLAGMVDNSAGKVSSGGGLSIDAGQLGNQQGVVAAGGGARLNIGQTDNRQGQLAAQGNVILDGETLNNDAGLIQSGHALTLTAGQISNRDSGKTGGITSQDDMQINASALNNDRGLLLTGKQARLDAGAFSNIAGTLVALDTLKITVQSDVDNRQGLLQGGGMKLDTRGHLLDNREGTLNSLGAMQLATAGLNNQHGTLGAKGDFTLQAAWLDNGNGGRVVGESSTTLTLTQLLNSGGQIQTVGSLLVNAVQGVIDNTQGLIRSGATATLNAAALINRDTLKTEKGIEGRNIVINSGELDNAVGSMLAGQNLSVTNSGTLDNSRGELAASYALTLGGSSLNLKNSAGMVKAGQQVTVQADRLSGDGQLLSLGDMALSSRNDINNSSEMIANGSFTLTTPGSVINSGKLLAGAKLNLSSGNLLNAATGEISAGSTWLTVADTLTNLGLIDGTGTRLQVGTLTNRGTGRIYGDYLGIQAGTLNDLAADGVAATIAGRERVDIGAGTLNNLDHALIYSGGDLALGGQLNANGMAIGQADVLNNHSSTIESAGNMALSVRQLNNINDHFNTEVVQVSTEQITEYQHSGSSTRWAADEKGVFIDRNSADNLLNLNTPEDTGSNNDNFYQYDYIRTTEEEVIKESDPGKILSGGNLSISADRVLNDKSQIVAGGSLGIAANSVDNVMPEGSRWITDEGSVIHYSRKAHKGRDEQGKSTSEYVPPTVIQSITLKPGKLEGNSLPDGSGLQIAVAQPQGTNATIGNTGSLSAAVTESDIRPGLQDIRVDGENGQAMVVRVTWPDTRLPDTSLFNTHPEPEAGYLVETDPRFTNNKQWLGSDYMQDAFSLSGDNLHKRLGDGYYEQRLVREQIIALTGGRYLADYRDDEAQFKGLMDAGIAFGREYNLIPGVALTAEQMSLLTEDMVWLVNTEVELADGTRQTVMVPQVYARVKEGDIDGSGALLGGQQVVMNLNSDLLNSGTISSREAVQLSAENITNKAGTVQGAEVSLQARTDINNIAGMIAGNHSVLASAGRDINILSTTCSAQSIAGENRFTRTTLDRVAGVYVQGADGKLSLSAGRDISLTGGQVSSSGSQSQTVLNAGRDLNLNTLVTSVGNSYSQNDFLAYNQHAGSTVQGGGNVLLGAGQNINIKASNVSAGADLQIQAERNIVVTSAQQVITEANHTATDNRSSTISAAGNLGMKAGIDLNVEASGINAGKNISLAADNDLNLKAVQTSSNSNRGNSETHSTDIVRTTISSGGDLSLAAGRDLNSQAAGLAAEGDAVLQAGRDLNLLAEATRSGDSYKAGKKQEINEHVRQQGTEIASGGDTTLLAGRDVNSTATQVTAQQDIAVAAGNNVNLTTATESDYHYKEETKTKKSFLKKKTTHTIEEDSATRESGTLLSGNNVSVTAGNDLLVKGSQVVGDGSVALKAGNNVDIVAATHTDSTYRLKETKKSGLMGTGGIGFTIGSAKARHEMNEDGITQSRSASTIGSTAGNVSISAGGQAHIGGSDLIAGKALSVTGDSVVIDPGHDKRTRDESFEQKRSGLTVALSGAVGSAVNSAVSAAQSAKDESDGRLAALQTTRAALSGVQAAQGMALAQAGGDPNNGMGVSLSLTTQKSKSEQHQVSDTVIGSTLNAGGNLSINATGRGNGAFSGDIAIGGSQLKAGGDTRLDATNDVLLLGAASTLQTSGKNSSSGGGVGIGIGIGGGSNGAGISIFANMNAARGKDKGNGTVWSETTVDSGDTITINSGRDTVLNGAQVSGDSVIAGVGRDLLISSQQDSNDYYSKQNSVTAGGSFTFGSMSGSGYLSASQDKMKSTYESVQEQTGIYAGSGGFDVKVGEHTQLDGAVIASTASADKNRLETGTLGFSDIHNEADYKVSHSGISLSGGGSFGGDQFKGNMPGGMLSGGGSSGHEEVTTQAAVAEGSIVIRDPAHQTQDVAALSRDTEQANDTVSPIFDKEKEQNRLKGISLIGEIGGQVMDIARTQGEIAGEKAKKDPAALKAAKEQLAGKGNRNPTDEEIAKQAYNTAMAPYGTGSSLQRGIQAATAAIQGLAGGNIAQAISGAAVPYLAEQIHKLTEGNPEAKAMAHAVVGAVTSYASGNGALAGAAGAVSGELMAELVMKQLYPGKEVSELTETEKQTISTLGTLAAGLAGGVTGGSTADAVVGAQAGKNSSENNFLHVEQIDDFAAKAKGCETRGDCQQIVKEMEDLSLKQQKEMIAVCAINPAACKEKYGDIPAKGMLVREALDKLFDADVPSQMKNDISSLWAQQMEAEGVVSGTEFAQEIQARWGIDKQQAEILAGAALGAVTGGMGKGGKPSAVPAGKNIVVVDSGKKGAWNKAMNNPEPNTVYKVDGNKTYHIDDQGRTGLAESTLSWSKNDRNTYQQCKAGKCGNSGDEGGHLIASIFNGPGEKLNLVPMDGNLNKGAWKQMENTWANALKEGKQVDVKIEPVYIGASKRPDSFSVTYSIDGGRPVIKDISNIPGGMK